MPQHDFKVGDHVIVDEGSRISHGLEVGLDAVVVYGTSQHYPRVAGATVSPFRFTEQYVDPAEPIYFEYFKPRSLSFDFSVADADAGHLDNGLLVELAEWLLSGKVPA